MVAEVGTEHNTTTILMIPSEFMNMARAASDHFMMRTPEPRQATKVEVDPGA